MDDFALLPGHGGVIEGRENIRREIGNRLEYLSNILDNPKPVSYEDATASCECDFLHSEWHDQLHSQEH